MSGFELNKIIGAILTAVLLVTVIGFVGDGLVRSKKHVPGTVVAASGHSTPAPAAEEKEESLAPVAPLLANADTDAGKKAANKCKACHDFAKGGASKLGPPLWGIIGRDKGGVDGFNYSGAMQKAAGDWTYEDLNAFLANPRKYVKGTKMVFAGIKQDTDRANLIAYLRSLADSPKPLP